MAPKIPTLWMAPKMPIQSDTSQKMRFLSVKIISNWYFDIRPLKSPFNILC